MTKMELFLDAMHDAPVIAAVKDNEGLERALASDNTVIFLLYGTILNISDLIRKTKAAGKMAFVHIEIGRAHV